MTAEFNILRVMFSEDLIVLSDKVINDPGLLLPNNSQFRKKLSNNLSTFLECIFFNPDIAAVAFGAFRIFKDEQRLYMAVLWNYPIDLSVDADKEAIRNIRRLHARLFHKDLEGYYPYLTSHLQIGDPRRYPTMGDFNREALTVMGISRGRVLACASFKDI